MLEIRQTRILYMEDDPGLARLIQKRLRQKGYSVEIAYDGEAGLSKANQDEYDVLLVDYEMPGYGGLEVICDINSKGKPVPTIMLTANGNERVAAEAMKLGAADYVVKDAATGFIELLPVIIEKVLHKQRLIEEREQMVGQLKESEERYRRLVELSPDGIAVHVAGELVFANPAAARMVFVGKLATF